MYRGYGHTHQFRFNVRPASQPIAGSMPVNCLRRWPNTNPTLGLLYTLRQHISKYVALTQCCFNVDPQSSTLAQVLLRHCYAGDAFHPGTRNTSRITRYIAPMLMSATLSQHYSNRNPSSSNHEYNRKYIFCTLFRHTSS